MAWTVLFSIEAAAWLDTLSDSEWNAIMGAIDLLEQRGPSLGRPAVDSIEGSRHSNMKELRSFGGHLRALFAFDPKRQALVILGGDKEGDWTGWYARNIPIADNLYDDYLAHQRETDR